MKRALSLFLAAVMVMTVVSMGFSFTAGAATKTPEVLPEPQYFTVPVIRTYGTNLFLRGTNVEAVGTIRFYLANATDIYISSNSSGVSVSERQTNGSESYWTVEGGQVVNENVRSVKFTVTYNWNGKTYSSSAWAYVCPRFNDACIAGGTDVAAWVHPTYGSVNTTSNSIHYNYKNYAPETDTSDAKSGIRFNSGSTMSTSNVPVATYYVDTSRVPTIQASDFVVMTRTSSAPSISISDQKLNGNSNAVFTVASNSGTSPNYSTKLNGSLPTDRYKLNNQIVTGRLTITMGSSKGYIDINVQTYDKESLRTLITQEVMGNRQESYFSDEVSNDTGYVRWSTYLQKYEQAWLALVREDVTQAQINTAEAELRACIPVYDNNGWVSGIRYAQADYSTVDHYMSQIPSDFMNYKYSDNTPGSYYTYTTASALNSVIDTIAGDSDLDKRYQSYVDALALELDTATRALVRKSFNIVFYGNGATDTPPTASYHINDQIPMPTSPTRRYYRFTGWMWYSQDDTNHTNPHMLPTDWNISMNPMASYFVGSVSNKDDVIRTGIELYAGWEIDATTITFELNGGIGTQTVIGLPGESVPRPDDPTKAGFNFDGWTTDPAGENFVDFSTYTFPDVDITLYAQWSVADFTVTFNANGGRFASTNTTTLAVTQSYGSIVTEPEVPIRANYGFTGWYTESENGTKINFDQIYTTPSSNTTLYAHWSNTSYTVSFETFGGTHIDYVTYNRGEVIQRPEDDPQRRGYTFDGWYFDTAFQRPVTFDNSFIMGGDSIVLYAKWNPNIVDIFFSLGNDQAQFDSTFVAADYTGLYVGTPITPPEDPTLEDHVFVGWTLNGELYELTEVPTETVTLVALWEYAPAMVKFSMRTDAPSDTLQQGDIVTVTTHIQSNYIVGTHQLIVYYDNRYYQPARNGEPYNETQNGNNAVSSNGTKFVTLVDNDPSLKVDGYNVWENGSATGRVNVSGTTINKFYPASWYDTIKEGNKTTYVLKDEYQYLDYVYVQISNASSSPSHGYCIMPKAGQDLFSFQLMVKDTAQVTTGNQTADILIPTNFTKLDDKINGRVYAAYEDGNEYDTAFDKDMSLENPSSILDTLTYVIETPKLSYKIEPMQEGRITFDMGASPATASDIVGKVGREVTLPTGEDVHWAYRDFLGWTTTPDGTDYLTKYTIRTGTTTLYAQYSAMTASYTERHWKQNLTATGYPETCDEYEIKYAQIGTSVTAVSKSYPGFTCISTTSDTVRDDNSTIVNAYYTRNRVTITLNPSGGSLYGGVRTLSGLYENTVTPPGNPTRTGFDFNGWLYNNSPYTFSTFPSSDIEVVASWAAKTYTLRFSVNDEEYPDLTITAPFGTAITEPTIEYDPDKSEFDGWYTNKACTEKYTFTTMPAENKMLYAKLNINGFYLTRIVDGAQVGPKIPVYTGTRVQEEDVAYTPPEGYIFGGWRQYNNPASVPVTFPMQPLTQDTTIYGFNSLGTYDLTFWLDGDFYFSYEEIAYGEDIEGYIPEMDEYIDEYVFDGWYTDENYTEKLTVMTMPAHNFDLYSRYTLIQGTFTFDLNGGTGTVPGNIQGDIYTTVTEFPSGEGFSNGYKQFLGWGLTHDATEPITSYEITEEETVTLYAIWKPMGVITFNLNGGSGDVPADIVGEIGSSVTEFPTGDGLSNGNRIFDGWGLSYLSTTAVTSVNLTSETPVTLYAIWVAQGSITFSMNGGAGTIPDDITAKLGTVITEFPRGTDFENGDKAFLGWALSPTATEPLTEYTIASQATVTLYAVWGDAAVKLVKASDESTAVIDEESKLIYGLKTGITEQELMSEYVALKDGRGRVEIIPYIEGTIGTGTIINVYRVGASVPDETYTIVIFGDITGNGIADNEDLLKYKAVAAQVSTLPEGAAFAKAGDITEDGQVESADLLKMKSVVAQIMGIDQVTGTTFMIV